MDLHTKYILLQQWVAHFNKKKQTEDPERRYMNALLYNTGKLCITYCAEEGDLEQLKRFVEVGVPLDTTDETGRTSFIAACEAQQATVAHYLLNRTCVEKWIHKTDQNGNTALHWARWHKMLDIVQAIARTTRNINRKRRREESDCDTSTTGKHLKI
jgi:ankyrin repeat protein